jgi:hypothetical protein
MRWPLTFYTENLPAGVGGRAVGPVIQIRASRGGDEGLYQHEWLHVQQWLGCMLLCFIAALVASSYITNPLWWQGLIVLAPSLHFILLRFPAYRYWSEIFAYRVQLKHSPGDVDKFVGYMMNNYGLKVPVAKIKHDLGGA